MEKIDWMSPDSENAKREIIRKSIGWDWDERISTSLWYEIGNIEMLGEDEKKLILTEFFGPTPTAFSEISLWQVEALGGNKLRLLRISGRLYLKPCLTLRGRYCPLYQLGHQGLRVYINFGAP